MTKIMKVKLLLIISCIAATSCRKNDDISKYAVTAEVYLDSIKINANIAFLPETQKIFRYPKESLSEYFFDNYNPSNGYNVHTRSVELVAGTYDIAIQTLRSTSNLPSGTFTFKTIIVNDSTNNSIHRMQFTSNSTREYQPWREYTP